MKNVYAKLMEVINEDQMSRDGKYLTHYNSDKELADDLFTELESEEFEDAIADKFNIEPSDIEGISFITLENQNVEGGGQVFVSIETTFDDVLEFMKQSSYRKYIK